MSKHSIWAGNSSTPKTKEEVIQLAEQVKGNPDSLTDEQRRAVKLHYPNATLQGVGVEVESQTSEAGSTGQLRDALQQTAHDNWRDDKTEDELRTLLNEKHPGATSEEIDSVIEFERRRQKLQYHVDVSTWTDKTGADVSLSYRNHPKQGVYALTRTRPTTGPLREKKEDILSYYIDGVTKHTNPLDSSEVTYSVLFKHHKDPRLTILYEEFALADITNALAHNQAGVRDSKGRVHAAVSTLIDHLDSEGAVLLKASIPATGFFESDGKLYHSDYKQFRITTPAYSKVKTKKALEVLGKILEFYTTNEDCDHALTAIYFMAGGPLGSIRKAHGKENKILLLAGTPHTGKTILEKINGYIWGLPESAAIIGSAKISPPQLATHLSLTSYPISFDEIRTALSNPTIADLLKSSTTGLLVKERILPKQGFRKQQFYAHASVIMSTNFVPDLYVGMKERIIPVEFTVRNRKGEDEAKTFDTYLNEHKGELGYLGAALRRLFTRNWSLIRGIALQDDQVKAGYEIMMQLCRNEGIESPEWLHAVKTRFDIDEPDPVQQVCDFMREDFMKILRNHYRPNRPDPKAPEPDDRWQIPPEWSARLDLLKKGGLLPSYVVNISPKSITVNNGIIREVAKRGHEIPGGLTGLAGYVNLCTQQQDKILKVDTYRSQKAISINREVFLAYVRPIDYQATTSDYQDQATNQNEAHD